MKKILFLLLLITSISFGQTTLANKLKIMGNATSTTATKVNVQETDGTVNTIAKTDLVDNIFVATVGDLPTTGVDGKIYVVKNVNKSYRWTGTFYQELSSTDLTGAVLTTGNQTKTGILSMTNPTGGGTNIAIINSGAGSDKYGLIATNNGSTNSEAIKSINNSTDAYGIHSDNNSSGVGLYSSNNSTGTGELIDNNSTGIGKLINNYSSGKSLVINNSTSATGIPLTVQKNGVDKATIDDSGTITANSFVGSGTSLTGIIGIPVIETGASFSLDNTYNGKVVILTASCTVTIPNSLVAGFECSFVTLAGVTQTISLGSSVVLFNNLGLTMLEKSSFTIKNRTTTNNYITLGNL